METIKNYLEAMFASMPNTKEVRKAKAELLAMMEDKYNEMIEEGINENQAVGTVISEFGNLDELAEDLGVEKEVEEVKDRNSENPGRFVSMEEIKDYLANETKSAWLVGIGVMLCITCVVYPPIFSEMKNIPVDFGVMGFFLSIGVGVALFIYNGIICSDWKFLRKEKCVIDISTANYVRECQRNFKPVYALCMTIGIGLCVISPLPAAVFSGVSFAALFLFVLVGVGVMLIIYAVTINGSYEEVLKINDTKTIAGTYGKEGRVEYKDANVETIMEVYWPTVSCLYLIISFLTFEWGITWAIWPIAAILNKILMVAFTKEAEYE